MSFFSSISDTFNSAKEWVSEAIDDTVDYGSDIIKQIGAGIKSVTADDKAIEYTKETESAQRLQQKHGINLDDGKDLSFLPFDFLRSEDGIDQKMMQAANNPLIQQAVRDTSSIFQQAQDPNNPTTQEDFLKKLNESNKLVAQTLKSYNIPVNEGTWSYEDTQDFINTAGTLTTKNRNYTGIDPATGKIKGLSDRANKEDELSTLSTQSARKEMTEYLRKEYAKNIEQDKFTILDSVVNRNTYFQIENSLTSYYASEVSSFDTMINQLEEKRSKVDPENIESFNDKIEQIVAYREKFKQGFKESAPYILANKDIDKANEEYRKKYNRDISDSMSIEYGEHSPTASKIFNTIDQTNLLVDTFTSDSLSEVGSLSKSGGSLAKTKMTLFDAAAQLKNEAVTQINAKSFADYIEKGISRVSQGTSFWTNYIGAKQEQLGEAFGISDELSKLNMTGLKNELESGELSGESSRLTRIGRDALDFTPYVLDLVTDPINFLTVGGSAVAKLTTKIDDATALVKVLSAVDKLDNTVDILKVVENAPELKIFQKAIEGIDDVGEMKSILRQEAYAANKINQAYNKATSVVLDGTKVPLSQRQEAIDLLKNGGGLVTDGRKFIINTLMEDKSTVAKAIGGQLLNLAYETVYMDAKMQNWMSAQYTPLDAAFSFGTEIALLGIKAMKNMNILSSNYMGDLKKYVGNSDFQRQFMMELFKDNVDDLKQIYASKQGQQTAAQTTKTLINSIPTGRQATTVVANKGKSKKILSNKQAQDISKAAIADSNFREEFVQGMKNNLSKYVPKGEDTTTSTFYQVVPDNTSQKFGIYFDPKSGNFKRSGEKGIETIGTYEIPDSIVITNIGDLKIKFNGEDISGIKIAEFGKKENPGSYNIYDLGNGYILERYDPDYGSNQNGYRYFYLGNKSDGNIPVGAISNSKNLGNITFEFANAKKIKGAVKLFSDTPVPTVEEWKAKFFDFIQKNYLSELQSFGATEMDLLYDSVYKTLQNSYYGNATNLTFDVFNPGNHHGVITASFIIDLIKDPQLASSFKLLANSVGYDNSIVKNFLAANIYQDPQLGVLFEKQIKTVMENGTLVNPKYRIETDSDDLFEINTELALTDIIEKISNSSERLANEIKKFDGIDNLRLSRNRKDKMSVELSSEITRQYNLIVNQMYAQQDYDAFGKLIDYNLQASYLSNSEMLLKSMGYESSIADMAASFFQYIGIRNLTNQLEFDPEFAKKTIGDRTIEASKEFERILGKIRKDAPEYAESVSAYQTASIIAKTMHEYKGQVKAVKEYVDSLSDPKQFSMDKFLDVYQGFLKQQYSLIKPVTDTDLDILDDFKNVFASIEKQFNQSLTETSSVKLKNRIVKDLQNTNIKDFLDSMENYLIKEGLGSVDNLFRLQGSTIGSLFVVNFGNVLYKNTKKNIRIGEILAEEGLHLLQSHLNLLDYNYKIPGLNKIEQKLEYLADDKWPIFQESITQAIDKATTDIDKALILSRSYQEIEADYIRSFIGTESQKDSMIKKFTEAVRFIEDQYIALEIKTSDKQIKNMKAIFMNKLSGLDTRNKILQSIPEIKREHVLKSFEGVRVDSPILGSIEDQYKLDKAYIGVIDELSLQMQSAPSGSITFRGQQVSFKPMIGGDQAEQLTYYTKLARKILKKDRNIISKLDPQEAYHVLGEVLRDANLVDKHVDYQVIKDFKSFVAAGSQLRSSSVLEDLEQFVKNNLGKSLDDSNRADVETYLTDQLIDGKITSDDYKKYQSQINIWVAGDYADEVLAEDLSGQVVPYLKAIQEKFVADSTESTKNFLKYNIFDFLLNSYYKSKNKSSVGLYSVSQFLENTNKFVVLKYVDQSSVENKTTAGFISWANKNGNRIILPDTKAEVIDIAGKSRSEVYDIIDSMPDGTAVFVPSGKIGRNFFSAKNTKIISGDEFPTVHFDVDSSNNLSFTFTSDGVFDNWIQEIGVPPSLYVKNLYGVEKEGVIKKRKDSFYETIELLSGDVDAQKKIVDEFGGDQIVNVEYMLSNTLQQGTPYAVGPGSQFFARFASSFINKTDRSVEKIKQWYDSIHIILTGELPSKPGSFYNELYNIQSEFKKDLLSITSSQFNEVKLFQAQNNFIQKYSQSTVDKNIIVGGQKSLNILDKKTPLQTLMQTVFLSDKFKSVKSFNPEVILNLLEDIENGGYAAKTFTKEESSILAKLYVSNKDIFSKTAYERLDDLVAKEISSDDLVDSIADDIEYFQTERQKKMLQGESKGQSLLGDEENKVFYDEVIEYLQTVKERAEDLLYGDGNNVLSLGAFDSRIINYINGKGLVENKVIKDDFVQKAFKGFVNFNEANYKRYTRSYYKNNAESAINNVKEIIGSITTNIKDNLVYTSDELMTSYYPIREKINRINLMSFSTSVKPLSIKGMSGNDFNTMIKNQLNDYLLEYSEKVRTKIGFLTGSNGSKSVINSLIQGRGYVEIPKFLQIDDKKIIGFARYTVKDFTTDLLQTIKKESVGKLINKNIGLSVGLNLTTGEIDDVLAEINNPKLGIYDAMNIAKQVLTQYYLHKYTQITGVKEIEILQKGIYGADPKARDVTRLEDYVIKNNLQNKKIPERFYKIAQNIIYSYSFNGGSYDVSSAMKADGIFQDLFVSELYDNMLKGKGNSRELSTGILNKLSEFFSIETVDKKTGQIKNKGIDFVTKLNVAEGGIEDGKYTLSKGGDNIIYFNVNDSIFDQVDSIFNDSITEQTKQYLYQYKSKNNPSVLGDLDDYVTEQLGYATKGKFLELHSKKRFEPFSYFNAKKDYDNNYGTDKLFASVGVTQDYLLDNIKVKIGDGYKGIGFVNNGYGVHTLIETQAYNKIINLFVDRLNQEFKIKLDEGRKLLDADPEGFTGFTSGLGSKSLLDAINKKRKYEQVDGVFFKKAIEKYEKKSGQAKIGLSVIDSLLTKAARTNLFIVPFGGNVKPGDLLEIKTINGLKKFQVDVVNKLDSIKQRPEYLNLSDGYKTLFEMYEEDMNKYSFSNGFAATISPVDEVVSPENDVPRIMKEISGIKEMIAERKIQLNSLKKYEVINYKNKNPNYGKKEFEISENDYNKKKSIINKQITELNIVKEKLINQFKSQGNKDIVDELSVFETPISSQIKKISKEIELLNEDLKQLEIKKTTLVKQPEFIIDSKSVLINGYSEKEKLFLESEIDNLNGSLESLLEQLKTPISQSAIDSIEAVDFNRQLNMYNQFKDDALYEDVKDYIILNSKLIADEFISEVNRGYVKVKTVYESGAVDSGGLEIGSKIIEEYIPLGKEIRGLEGKKYALPEFKIEGGELIKTDPVEWEKLGINTLSSLNCNI